MATVVARVTPVPERTSTPPPHLTLNTSSRGTPAAVPNKHIPICSPGPNPTGLETPPASPPSKDLVIETSTLLFPPNQQKKILDDPPLYAIDANGVAQAVEHMATHPLPDPKLVFPWLHGLHAENHMQSNFFISRRKSLRKVPRCLRGITIVKAGGNLGSSRLKGAVSPEELLLTQVDPEQIPSFIDIDPKDGFSVRNFQIQACKMGTISDIIVYSDGDTSEEEVMALAKRISQAQRAMRQMHMGNGFETHTFNTFVVSDAFSTFEENHKNLVAVDSKGYMTGNVVDFFFWERKEMCTMSKASEISRNVYLGPTPDSALDASFNETKFNVYIETSDLAQIPDTRLLKQYCNVLEEQGQPLQMEFPSSGSIMPPTWSQAEVDGLMEVCRWIYGVANPDTDSAVAFNDEQDQEGDQIMLSDFKTPQKILIHCTDGYTETSLLGLAYFMYAEGVPAHEAWVQLHRDKGRNFFAYPSDVALLTSIQPRILQESPRWRGSILSISDPIWLSRIDGSLPSRILPYMYLGNLTHANNPQLLKELGITRILSVGEPLSWPKDSSQKWPASNLLYIDRVQDNGIDPLTEDFGRCLKFIERGKLDGTATLVHCRVGVSRSATICIAEVMSELGLSFPRAYCFVRARRLNVIIQPHLRFTYELLKWEEYQHVKRGEPLRRDLEWATISREIALMNKPYSRQ